MGYGPIFFKVAHISDMGAHVSIWAPNLINGGWGRSPKIMPKTTSHPGKYAEEGPSGGAMCVGGGQQQ